MIQVASAGRQAGASTVEILFVIPVLFVMVFTILEFTNILRNYHAISWVAEYGVREASLSAASVKDIIRDKLVALGVKNVDRNKICVQYSNDSGGSWEPNWEPGSGSPCTDPVGTYVPGNLVKVTINVTYEPFLPRLLVPQPTFGVTFERVLSR